MRIPATSTILKFPPRLKPPREWRGIARIVNRSIAEAYSVLDAPPANPPRWPLERRMPDATTLPVSHFHPAEIVGGYVRLLRGVICSFGTVAEGAVLPVVGYDAAARTFTLQLAKPDDRNRPAMTLSGVPAKILEIVPGLNWKG